MFQGFKDEFFELDNGVTIRARIGGEGAPVLLLHGYPQTSACWHIVAPQLVANGYKVIVPDIRGYGRSDKPTSSADHSTYSKREMASDQIGLMRMLGYESFYLVGHDRGGRVAHRAALDFPDAITKVAVLDIAPTAAMYDQTDRDFATGYYHWFFLIQPEPLPERMIGADPDFYLKSKLSAWGRSGDEVYVEAAVEEYCAAFRDPACIHASCEDYRASASIDLEHDSIDKDRKIEAPLLALWGTKGLVGKLYNVIELWEERATNVTGYGLAGGHFLPEECPDETVQALIEFFRSE